MTREPPGGGECSRPCSRPARRSVWRSLVTVFASATRTATGTPHQILVTGMTAAFVASAIIVGITFLVALTFQRTR